MLALPGMTREEFERIRPYVAALPVGTKINLCTAKAPVLAALIEGGTNFGDAEQLATNRKDGCFPTKEDLQNDPSWNAMRDSVEQKSDWFRAVTAVRIGTSEFTLYSLIERNGSTAIRTVLRSTGTE
jgi:general secretion pathway protein K